MDIENALISNIQHAGWIEPLALYLHFPKTRVSWEDRFAAACDQLMETAGLETFERDGLLRTIIAFPHGTRRKRPAFIAIHSGHCRHFHEAFGRVYGATFTIEFVEAGKYGVAGESPTTDTGTEAEDTALQH